MAIGGLGKLPKNKKDAKKFFGKGDGKPFKESAAAKAGWKKNNRKGPNIGRTLRNVAGGGLLGSGIGALRKRRK